MTNNPKQALYSYIQKYNKVAVAFSGGVDSTLLLKACSEAIGPENTVAITVKSPYIPKWELEEAIDLAKQMGVKHEVIHCEVPEVVRNNPEDRCYLCKKEVFGLIIEKAKTLNCDVIFDGTNIEDLSDYRPGLRALAELGVDSPLKEAKYTKSMIRELSATLGLPTWDKPAYACLLTRIPYHETITQELLIKIEKSEEALLNLGFRGIRVRAHGDLARIEIATDELMKLFDLRVFSAIDEAVKQAGFKHVTVDLAGYKTGGFNDSILQKGDNHE